MFLGFQGNLGSGVRCSQKSPCCLIHAAPAKPPTTLATGLPSSSPEMSRLHKTRHLSLCPYQPQLSPEHEQESGPWSQPDEPPLTSACFFKDEPHVKLDLVLRLRAQGLPWHHFLPTSLLGSRPRLSPLPLKLPIQSCILWPSHPNPGSLASAEASPHVVTCTFYTKVLIEELSV